MARNKRRAGFAFLNPSKLIFVANGNERHQHLKLWLAGWLALALAGWLWLAGAGWLALVWLAGAGWLAFWLRLAAPVQDPVGWLAGRPWPASAL